MSLGSDLQNVKDRIYNARKTLIAELKPLLVQALAAKITALAVNHGLHMSNIRIVILWNGDSPSLGGISFGLEERE